MKKKAKKFLKWFFTKNDRPEDNLKEYKNLYELIERLQYKVESLEHEQMILLKEINKCKSMVCDTEYKEILKS